MKGSVLQYKAIYSALREVWASYGGWSALFGSPFLHLSILFSLLSFGTWRNGDWWESGLSVVPAILGFAIGTFAIFVALGDEKFREMLAKGGKLRVKSVRDIYVSFVFLITLQAIAVLFCMLAASRPLVSIIELIRLQEIDIPPLILESGKIISIFSRFIGFTLVVYSVLSVIPMTLSVLRMGSLYLGYFLIGTGAGRQVSDQKAENVSGNAETSKKKRQNDFENFQSLIWTESSSD
jgi:hypothetical protein